jgi:hypothetical protein
MHETPHNGAFLPAMSVPDASARGAWSGDFAARLAALAVMAEEAPRTMVTPEAVELIRRNIEILELLLGGQAFNQTP